MATRKPYPNDVSDDEWTFVAPYLALVREDAPQREYDLREVLKTGSEVDRTHRLCVAIHAPRPAYTREAVYQQTQRWLKAGVFEQMIHDLCAYFCGFLRRGLRSRVRP